LGQPASTTAGLTKTGNGALILNGGNSSYSGFTTINGGTLQVLVGSKLYNAGDASGALLVVNSGATLSFEGGWGWAGTFGYHGIRAQDNLINGGTIQHTGTGNAQDGSGAGRLFTVGASGATLDSATVGELFSIGYRYDYSTTLGSSAGGSLTLTGEGNGDLSYIFPGTGSLIKTGTGTWTLNQANTYTGNTTVKAGTLVVNYPNFANSSTVSVTNGAMLDLGAVDFTNTVAGLVLGGVSRAPGQYNATTDPTYLAGSGSLLVVNPIPSTPTNIVSSVSGGNLTLSWPANYTGWSLLTQTNNLNQGVSSNTNDWMVVPGSTTTNQIIIPINPSTPAGFYRMRY
jgi:autotransporter-associated beta strand protein